MLAYRVQKEEALLTRPNFDMEVVGNNLRRLRKAKNLKVTEVRDYLGFESTQAVYKYESGNGYPQVETMFALMMLYDASIDDLIYPTEEVNSFDGYSVEGDEPSSFLVFFQHFVNYTLNDTTKKMC